MKYLAFLALTGANAIRYTIIPPAELHWNEDRHSRPDPLSGEYPDRTMTTTQARWIRNENTDAAMEPEGKNM